MSLFGVELAHPWFLLAALLAIPAVWWAGRGAGRVVFSSLRALPGGGHTWRTRIAWLPDALFALAVTALAIALTGPRAGDKTSRVRREGIPRCRTDPSWTPALRTGSGSFATTSPVPFCVRGPCFPS